MAHHTYAMRTKIWLYPGDAAWHFATIPPKLAAEVRKRHGANAKGWGSLPVKSTVGKTSWRTSIFPDRRAGVYLLPLKAEVRKKENIGQGDTIALKIEVRA
jgi:Domain of unknown function (DUF1905)